MFRNTATNKVDDALRAHYRECRKILACDDDNDDERDDDRKDDSSDSRHEGAVDPAFTAIARDFLANQDTSNREELLFRAAREADNATGTWTREASARYRRAFTAAVAGLIPRQQRTARKSATPITDFPGELMFME